MFDFYIDRGVEAIRRNDHKALLSLLEQAVADFNGVDIYDREFTKIGLVGEIYVKYNSYGQAHITEWLRSWNMEVVTPPLIDFVIQDFVNSQANIKNGLQKYNLFKHCQSYCSERYRETVEEVLSGDEPTVSVC